MGGSGWSPTAATAQSSTWRFRQPRSSPTGRNAEEKPERAPRKSVGNRIRQGGPANETVSMTVLIVDDHPSFRASARELLEAEGYEIVGEAENGAAALQAVRDLRPDLVLLDVQLPDMDGFQVAEQLCGLANPPAVVLTSSRDSADYGRCIQICGAS